MQASLIGLRHLEQARIPISARLNSGLGWTDGMMLALDQAGAQHSQSPVGADKGAVMGPACSSEFRNSGQYCSLSELVNRLQESLDWNESHAGTSAKHGKSIRPNT
jgi:hypothetical protein